MVFPLKKEGFNDKYVFYCFGIVYFPKLTRTWFMNRGHNFFSCYQSRSSRLKIHILKNFNACTTYTTRSNFPNATTIVQWKVLWIVKEPHNGSLNRRKSSYLRICIGWSNHTYKNGNWYEYQRKGRNGMIRVNWKFRTIIRLMRFWYTV